MLRKTMSFFGLLEFAAATFFVTPEPSQASQPRDYATFNHGGYGRGYSGYYRGYQRPLYAFYYRGYGYPQYRPYYGHSD